MHKDGGKGKTKKGKSEAKGKDKGKKDTSEAKGNEKGKRKDKGKCGNGKEKGKGKDKGKASNHHNVFCLYHLCCCVACP